MKNKPAFQLLQPASGFDLNVKRKSSSIPKRKTQSQAQYIAHVAKETPEFT